MSFSKSFQSVEMARIRRDDTEADNTDIFQSLIETLGTDFEQSEIFKEFKEIMKEFSAVSKSFGQTFFCT